MPNYLKPVLTSIFLAAIAIIAYRGHSLLWDSAVAYRSPIASSIPVTDEAPPQLSERVALVVISGLGTNTQQSVSMPTLERLQQSGAEAVIRSAAPTYRQPAWNSLLSGATPAINDALLFGDLEGQTRPIDAYSLFHIADRHGVKSLMVGHPVWLNLIPHDLLDTLSIVSIETVPTGTQFVDSIADELEDKSIRLMVVQFSLADEVAQSAGPLSEDYPVAVKTIDEQLAQLVGQLDLSETTLIVTSDYGITEDGKHGGPELTVTELPLAMAGKNIIPGTYSPVEQIDIAPTVSALLGLPVSAINQGRPLLEMLQLSEQNKALILAAQARQQLALTQAWPDIDTMVPDDTSIDDVDAFLLAENYTGATGLAKLIIKETTGARLQSTLLQENSARLPRAIIVGVVVLALLLFIYKDHSTLWIQALISGSAVVAAYHLIYRLTGNVYSLSAIAHFEQTRLETGQRLAFSLAVGGFVFLALLLLQQQNDRQAVFAASFEMFLFAAIGFLVPVMYGFVIIGPTISGLFPDVSIFFLYVTGQMQLFWTITLGILLPPLIMLIFFLAQKVASLLWGKQIT